MGVFVHKGLAGPALAVGGYVGVQQMQTQLQRIASEFAKSNIDPAQYDGKLTLGTIIALANAAPVAGSQIDSSVGTVVGELISLIKAPIELLPYGDTIIEFVLSPWIVDKVYGAILEIIRLVPGGGGAADAIDHGLDAAKTAVANAASVIAAALSFVKKSNGLGRLGSSPTVQALVATTPINMTVATSGDDIAPNPPPGFTWVAEQNGVPGHWERARVGQTPQPGPTGAYLDINDHRGGAGGGGVTVTDSQGNRVPTRLMPLAPLQPGQPGIVRDQRTWPAGKSVVSTEWGRGRTYYGSCPKANLSDADRATWEQNKDAGPFGSTITPSWFPGVSPATLAQLAKLRVRYGTIAFVTFRGYDGARMGAFWDEDTQMLKICVVPEPSSSKWPWDYVADAVVAAADEVAEIAQDTWNWIAENADDVYEAIKKYGCAIVNNDIVVGLAAAGAGIVASPAASAAVVEGATAGKTACAVMEVAEVLYAIYKLLSMDIPPPPSSGATKLPSPIRVVMPFTRPRVPLAKPKYPAGSIAAFDPMLRRYRIAIPIGTQLQLGAALGAAATHFEVETSDAAPAGVTTVTLSNYQKATGTTPLYKNPIVWAGAGGAVVVGGLIFVAARAHRRRAAFGRSTLGGDREFIDEQEDQ